MTPTMNITAWARFAPWAELRQIEQDLIVSRAIVELFNDEFLRAELRFRGGTALNKLHFPAPLRYSEDIDLVRTTHGPIKELLSRIRETLEPWLGQAGFEQSKISPKLIFKADAEGGGPPLKLKVEINTRETQAFDESLTITHRVENSWFAGEAPIATFSNEEMLATKLRALLQRDKGRDLLDLSHGRHRPEVVTQVLGIVYRVISGHPTRAIAEGNSLSQVHR
jgi:predicted nucleotidyltransferase component of viral defense system